MAAAREPPSPRDQAESFSEQVFMVELGRRVYSRRRGLRYNLSINTPGGAGWNLDRNRTLQLHRR